MANMKLGSNKLVVNIARFAKENDGILKDCGEFRIGKEGHAHHPGVQSAGPSRLPDKFYNAGSKGRSFVDILLNKSVPASEHDVVDVDPSVFSLSDKFGKALVGRTVNFSVLRNINVLLREAGFKDIVIQYFGGLTVLLSFKEELAAKSFAEDSSVWARWFAPIDLWVGQSLPFERLAWINIFGVPPHLFFLNVFNSIGGRYGRVVQESQSNEEDRDLTFDCIGVLTDNGISISGLLKLRWQDNSYRVLVKEEPSVWVPDFLGNINGVDVLSSGSRDGDRNVTSTEEDGSAGMEVGKAGNKKVQSESPHGDPVVAAQVSMGDVPMHVEPCNNFVPSSGGRFVAQDKVGIRLSRLTQLWNLQKKKGILT
ncbi:hypothetical protein HanHA300_Chr04g0149011 [Helianthus annuus]|nr:hypothetical protein HanHA300_Chr04g0149011 [Helianthus annuus]KAJ0598129.1 hypothetical protein HanHA89_Chr04g0162391 [Helianthus annuus]